MAAAGLAHCVDSASGDEVRLLKIRCVRDVAGKLGSSYVGIGERAAAILRAATRNFGRPNH